MQCDSAAALAWLAAAEGDHDRARELCALVLEPVVAQRGPPLRGLGSALGGGLVRAQRGARRRARRAPRRSRRSPRRPGIPTRWRRSRTRWARPRWPRATPARRPQQLSRAVELHEDLDIPFERAQILAARRRGAGRRRRPRDRARRSSARPTAAPALEQVLVVHVTDGPRRHAHDDGARRDVVGDDGARGDERLLADLDAGHEDGAAADAAGAAQGAALKRRAGREAGHRVVVGRRHARADEDVVLDDAAGRHVDL